MMRDIIDQLVEKLGIKSRVSMYYYKDGSRIRELNDFDEKSRCIKRVSYRDYNNGNGFVIRHIINDDYSNNCHTTIMESYDNKGDKQNYDIVINENNVTSRYFVVNDNKVLTSQEIFDSKGRLLKNIKYLTSDKQYQIETQYESEDNDLNYTTTSISDFGKHNIISKEINGNVFAIETREQDGKIKTFYRLNKNCKMDKEDNITLLQVESQASNLNIEDMFNIADELLKHENDIDYLKDIRNNGMVYNGNVIKICYIEKINDRTYYNVNVHTYHNILHGDGRQELYNTTDNVSTINIIKNNNITDIVRIKHNTIQGVSYDENIIKSSDREYHQTIDKIEKDGVVFLKYSSSNSPIKQELKLDIQNKIMMFYELNDNRKTECTIIELQ